MVLVVVVVAAAAAAAVRQRCMTVAPAPESIVGRETRISVES